MMHSINVWNTDDQFGDVVIATFSKESDAILFAKAKAKREGGFISTLWVGDTYETRRQVSVD